MRAAGSAARSSAGVAGFRGVVSVVLRGLAASFRVGGGGAFSSRAVFVAGLVLAVVLVAAPSAVAGKLVDRVIGDTTAGTTGGLFNAPEEVAVNDTGVGGVAAGTFYVADDLNHRIQRFSPSGTFELAWGADVDLPAGGTDLEVCTVAANCKAGVASGGNGTAAGNGALNRPRGVAVDGDTGRVYVSSPSLRRVSVYDADGNFERAFGFDVAASGPGNTGTGFEVCVQANGDICKLGTAGAGVGQLASLNVFGGSDIVVTPPDSNAATGKVYYADTGNRRVSVYDVDGTAPSSFGTTADYTTNNPGNLAIDSNGIVYSSDRTAANVNEVKRYDTAGASFLAPIDPNALATDGVPSNQTTAGLTIDPDTGNLLVARRDSAMGVLEIANPATSPAFVDRHLTTVVPAGVEVNSVTGEILEFLNHRVLVLDDDGAVPANVTLGAITDVTAQGATLNATIESVATGLPTNYRFEVSANGVDWTTVANGAVPNGATEDVSGVATGLLPNTLYRVRVVANRTLGNPDVASAESSFVTDAVPPTVVSSGVESTDTDSARLFAYVNPNSSQTSYRFEWGTAADALANRVPMPNGTLGAGGANVFTAQTIPDLQPGTTYHYRLLATSAAGTTTTAARTFTTRAEPLPERGWEMVSPTNKDPNAYVQDFIIEREPSYQVSADGDGVFYTLTHAAEGAVSGSQSRYLASRGEAGWLSEQMSPALTSPLTGIRGWAGAYGYLSPDLDCGVLQSTQPLTPDAPDEADANLFRHNPDGSYDWLTPEPINPNGTAAFPFLIPGVSPDCGNVVFATGYRFAGVNDSGVYRNHNGMISDVAVLPNGVPASSAGVGALSSSFGEASLMKNAVSADASHVYFSAISNGGNPPGTGDDSGKLALYLHREGEPTIKVSGSETATINQRAVYQIASRDGGKVAFMANYGLTSTSSTGPVGTNCQNDPPQPCALYVYDVDSGDLVDISATGDPANSNGATVAGVVGASKDLSRIYFASQAQLVPGEGRSYSENIAKGTTSNDSTYNVYMYSEGEGLTFVGLISKINLIADHRGMVTVHTEAVRNAQVTPDGSTLLFTSNVDNVGYDSLGFDEAYLFSAESGEVVCVSCRRDGEAPIIDSLDMANTLLSGENNKVDLAQPVAFKNDDRFMDETRVMSDDGSRVVFTSHDALAAGAIDGNQNIYLWDSGTISLLDTGAPARVQIYNVENYRDLAPYVVGMSPDGDNVFIRTISALVPQDIDGVKDLYVFRVGGGFPDPPAPPQPCGVLADGCQGGGFGAVSTDTKTSSSTGSDNASAERRKTLALSGLSKKARKRAARRGVLPIRLRSSSAGRVRLTAKAKLGKRAARVGRKTVRIRKAGALTVKLRLNKKARKRLRSGKELRVTIEVRQSGARTRTRSILLPGVRS